MSKENKNSTQSSGVELVLERNCFYKEGLVRLRLVAMFLIALNLILAICIGYKFYSPVPPQYFATTASGRILKIYPLSQPVLTDSYVLQWTANKVRLAFALDYMHWHQQLQDVSGSFTTRGWKYFSESLQASNNLSTLTSLKMVSNAVIVGAPQVQQKAVIGGHFMWKVKLSILVSYNNLNKGIPMPMDVTVIVMRMPVQNFPNRIAINNFLPVPEQ